MSHEKYGPTSLVAVIPHHTVTWRRDCMFLTHCIFRDQYYMKPNNRKLMTIKKNTNMKQNLILLHKIFSNSCGQFSCQASINSPNPILLSQSSTLNCCTKWDFQGQKLSSLCNTISTVSLVGPLSQAACRVDFFGQRVP